MSTSDKKQHKHYEPSPEKSDALVQTDLDKTAAHQEFIVEDDSARHRKTVSDRPGAADILSPDSPITTGPPLRPDMGRSGAAARAAPSGITKSARLHKKEKSLDDDQQTQTIDGVVLGVAATGVVLGQAAEITISKRKKKSKRTGKDPAVKTPLKEDTAESAKVVSGQSSRANDAIISEADIDWLPPTQNADLDVAGPKLPRYGTMESTERSEVAGEGIGSVAFVADTTPPYRVDDPSQRRDKHKSMIKDESKVRVEDQLVGPGTDPDTVGEAVITPGTSDRPVSQGRFRGSQITKTARGVVLSEAEMSLARFADSGDTESKAAVSSVKHEARSLIGIGNAVGTGIREGTRLTRYGFKLKADVAAGKSTVKEALAAFGGRANKSGGTVVKSLGTSTKSILVRDLEEFHADEDDLGLQALQKPKDMVVHTKNTYKGVSRGVKTTKKVGKTAWNGSKAIAHAVVAVVKKTMSNPIVIKIALVVGIVALLLFLVIAVIGGVVSSFTSVLSVKSDGWDLTQAYSHVTKLDTDLQYSLTHVDGVDDYRYIINGVECESINIYTDADRVLMYLDAKYEDYKFSDVKDEIGNIHNDLWNITSRTRKTVLVTTDEGGQIEQTWYYVTISVTSIGDYINDHTDAGEKEQLAAFDEAGAYTFRAELRSPFPGQDLSTLVTSRFGWRILNGEKNEHNALDLGAPLGTPIHACMSGTVDVPPYSNSYGNYLKIVDNNGNYTLYAHMNTIAVTDGQTVSAGDVIGYVGSTGNSTGPHLHLEYCVDGHRLNPFFFLEQD